MARDVLTDARRFMRMRRFKQALILLQNRSAYYEENFEYFLLLATVYLYLGDTGNASVYFQKARNIHLTDTNLLLGQAALFLRRGDTARAIQYYIDILDFNIRDPLQYSCLENPRDGGAWWADVYGVTQSRTRLK